MAFFSREKHTDHNPRVYFSLVRRHFMTFFKSKISVVFALLVPMITLIIYVIFLRQLQVNAIDMNIEKIIGESVFQETKDRAHLLADAWMLSGIVAVSCISVSLNTCTIMVSDKLNGVSKDFISSPISRRSINFSYLMFNILATFLINFIVLFIAYVYLGITGGWQISFTNTILLIPTLLLSVISASLITCFIGSFIRNYNTFNSASVIVSSASGFLIGAYMPVTMLPGVAKKIPPFFPGTYSAGLLRYLCLQNYYENFQRYLIESGQATPEKIQQIINDLNGVVSMDVDFFGMKVTPPFMFLAIALFILLFIVLDLIFLDHNLRSAIQGKRLFRKKK